MNKSILLITGVLLLSVNTLIAQHQIKTARPDAHAPISVMGDHNHKKGGLMFSYRNMPMWMKGNLNGDTKVSNEEIYQNYMTAPQKMEMNMHMFSVMYGVSNKVTLMVMANYLTNHMDLTMRMMGQDTNFSTESKGFGDVSLSGSIRIYSKNKQSLQGNIGVSIPTGSIDNRDNTPMKNNALLGYPMQLGSGTWDPMLGVTYLGKSETFSWGLQPKYIFRIGENARNYTLGNQLNVVGWGALKVSDFFSFSTSLSYFNIEKTKGNDAEMNPKMMPLYNTENSGRSQVDVGLGTNIYLPKGSLKNLRFALEVKLPVYQKVNGIQMKNSFATMFGIQYAIGHKHHK
ncbi:transporter [Tenacibaculum sp. UWU-22]|uniref:transporter n=1 Tax=Tenacibaculum sp. UWU-22 TaxID=3234187 RepID=UPI0034DAF700